MKLLGLLLVFAGTSVINLPSGVRQNNDQFNRNTASQKVQVAILLDVSGSMEGLIEQAKAQLWNMVTTLGKAKCDNNQQPPQIEIALYEYGRTDADGKTGYVKQLSGFTTDLDKLSATLFSLTTDGGDEYCGQVIKTSLEELNWDPAPGNYKVIFIAGNEDFLQGGTPYTQACAIAKQKGVIVNTIYCGDRAQGIAEHWKLNNECGTGSFTNINQEERTEDIETPYDSALYVLNEKLNATYIGYGYSGAANKARQEAMDKANAAVSRRALMQRNEAKVMRGVYDNSGWDLVDAYSADSTVLSRVDTSTLPDSLKGKSKQALQIVVIRKTTERNNIRQELTDLHALRNNYINDEKRRRGTNGASTLETEMEKLLRIQAREFGIVVE
ncbi:MAG TPA: vWA domain-containing protein [Chitinophagaceae bacterium]